MTYEVASGELWNGLLADGTFDLSNVKEMFKDYRGHETHKMEVAIADLIYNEHQKRKRRNHQANNSNPAEVQPQCELPYRCHLKYPACDTYVLRTGPKSKRGNLVFPYSSPIIDELRKGAPNRFLVLTYSNCKDMERCTKEALDKLSFEPQPREAYENYRSFSRAAKSMIQDSIEYFEAPCVKLYKHLEQLGFSGDHI